MNIKNKVFLLYKIQTFKLVWARAKDGPRKVPSKNGAHPEDEEREDLEIRGCRSLQQE